MSRTMDETLGRSIECPENMRSYLEDLEEELRKIQVFRRELPLCMELVTRAIEACKHRLSETTTVTITTTTNGLILECSELNSTKDSPVLEEFIPIKASSYEDQMDHEEAEYFHKQQHAGNDGSDDKKKTNWLKSAQLWNPNPESTHHDEDLPPSERASVAQDGKTNTLISFLEEKEPARNSRLSSGRAVTPLILGGTDASTSSTAEKGCDDGISKREEKQKPGLRRKPRRCWASDLHRRFLHAVQQLGGPHVATPKQIRELMKIDSLTNDEVKSHLQKYRIHAKNIPHHNSRSAVHQPPQFVVVGGIWMPQPQYETAHTSPVASHGIYAQVVTPLPIKAATHTQHKPISSSSDQDRYEAHESSHSATTSCSAHTVSVY